MSMVLHWSAREQKCRLDEGLYLSANRLNSADYDLDIAAVSGPHLLSFSLSGPVFLSLFHYARFSSLLFHGGGVVGGVQVGHSLHSLPRVARTRRGGIFLIFGGWVLRWTRRPMECSQCSGTGIAAERSNLAPVSVPSPASPASTS